MNHSKYLFAILLLIIRVGVGNCKECRAKAILLSFKELKEKLHGKIMWTKIYAGKPTMSYPSRGGVAVSEYYFSNDTQDVATTTYKNGVDKEGFGTFIWKEEHLMTLARGKAIFKMKNKYQVTPITQGNTDVSGDLHISYMNTFEAISPDFNFALIFINEKKNYFIFQACDLSYAWVQIEKSALKKVKQCWAKFHDHMKTLLPTLGILEDPTYQVFIKLFITPNSRFDFDDL